MVKAALLDAWPLAALLVAVCFALAALIRVARKSKVQSPRSKVTNSSLDFRHWTLGLHFDERGSVQSLSFVLTVPLFIMLMLLAVQITQLMIGQIVVHYAAFAAARSAAVWIPARVDSDTPDEWENRIGMGRIPEGTEDSGEIWRISPGGMKFEQIRRAAALACVAIAPSRDFGLGNSSDATTQSLVSMFSALSPTAESNSRVPVRLTNKWAYSNQATTIQVRTFHRRYGQTGRYVWDEPPLDEINFYRRESPFKPNEIGWRDQIRVTVFHQFALLPGPGRLLARRANESVRADTVSPRIRTQANSLYTIELSATATMVGEGEKSVKPYVY